MKWMRYSLKKNRIFILAFLLFESFYFVEGQSFIYAYQGHQKKEARLQEISELLGIPVEKLRPDHGSLFDSVRDLFGKQQDAAKAAGLKRLQETLQAHQDLLASNPYLSQIEAVKNAHMVSRTEGLLQDLMRLTTPETLETLSESSQRALLRNLHHDLQAPVKLPPLPAGLPASAQAKQTAMQAELDRLFESVRPIVASTQEKALQGTIAQKVEQLRLFQDAETRRPIRKPRFVDRPLPLRQVEKKARTLEASRPVSQEKKATSTVVGDSAVARRAVDKMVLAPEIVALAESLGNSPARIFTWVHDEIDFDPKWGATKNPLGTLWERSGTSWEQAALLQSLLAAAGVDARFEWGEVEITTEMLTNITGLSDPFRAGDLLTTAGIPIVLLTQGSQVVAARMSHVWVKAFVDYIPNRGVEPGPGDTWIRLDPSLKRFDYAPGIQIHDQVPFSLGDYLISGTPLSPRRAFEDSLWSYIRANNIECTTLEQLKPAGQVIAEGFPFLPGTLRSKILSVAGESAEMPTAFEQRLRVEVRSSSGASLLTFEGSQPELALQRVEVAWKGATPDDQATLDSFGGVFETPPYLVDLVPTLRVGGVERATGSAVGSAEEVEISVTTTPAGGVADVFVHEGFAGEPSVLVTAFGKLPQELLDRFQQELQTATAGGDESAILSATLQMLGATYFHNLGRDVEDIAGWNWHRLVRLVSEGLIVQTGEVTTTVNGSPLSFRRAERFVDFPGFIVGLFHATGDANFVRPTLELAGAQGSFLEGEVFDQVLTQVGLGAVSALTLARREGQVLQRIDPLNVDSVLAQITLEDSIESTIRQAVAQGKVAWTPESEILLNDWQGVGYILEDPETGAAAYLISGGFAGGVETGKKTFSKLQDMLGDETWLSVPGLTEELGVIFSILGGANVGDNGPSTNHSDPVNLASGNYWRSTQDLLIQAIGIPIVWARTYNSRSTYNGPLGYGWTFTLGEHLVRQSDASILYREGDGSEHEFTPAAGGGFDSPDGKYLELTEDASGFSLREKDGMVKEFDTVGRLTSMADPNGNQVTLSYDGGGNLESVTDAAGRQVLTVTTVAGKITRITDLSGREVVYGYEGDDLVSVLDVSGDPWSHAYDPAHNLIAWSNPLGETDNYRYDVLDRCVAHTDPLGFEEQFSYSSSGERAVITDKRGYSTFVEFDARGRATTQVDPLGNVSRSTWDGANNRTKTVNPRGGETTMTYDDQGNLLSTTNPLGEKSSYTYEPQFNRVTTITNPEDQTVTVGYDGRGNLTSMSQMVNGELYVESFVPNSRGQIEEVRDAENRPVNIVWHPTNGAPESQTDALNQTTIFTSDRLGRIEQVENPAGDLGILTWDEEGRIIGVKDYFDNQRTVVYDEADRPVTQIVPQGTSRVFYDPLDRVLSTIDPQGNRRSQRYDAEGNVVEQVDELGNKTTMTYDALGRLLAQVDPLGQVWTFSYCAEISGCGGGSCGGTGPGRNGSFCELVDPLGNVTRQEHDALGRVVQVTNPLGHKSEVTYDRLGQKITMRDALERITRHEYDELGRLTAVVEANGARTEYTYDKASNLKEIRDAEERRWTRTYDLLNRMRTRSDPLGNVTTLTYDLLGNVETETTANDDVITYDYDVRRLLAIHLPGGVSETFSYSENGEVLTMANNEVSVSFEYDEKSQPTRMVNHTLNQTVEYRYDARGRRTALIRPEGTVTMHYDALGRLVEQVDPVVGTYRFTYDALSRRESLEYPNGLLTRYSYDAASRLESVITTNGAGEVVDGYRYTYDAMGNRDSMVTLHEGVRHDYEYDEVYRLKRWDRGPDRFEEYTYDLVSNREVLSDQDGDVVYSYDDANRLLGEVRNFDGGGSANISYSWDDNGNLLSKEQGGFLTTYDWDAVNRLTDVVGPGGTFSFGYDPKGIRVRETRGGQVQRFLHGQEDVLGVYDEAGQNLTYYSHGPGFDEPLAEVTAGSSRYLHHDGLGSITFLSDEGGEFTGRQSYAAFGALESSTGARSRYGFTGRDMDETGLSYHRARYYDPTAGRFISADPFQGLKPQPLSLHDYVYANDNPTNFVDPTGFFPWKFSILLGIFSIGWLGTFLRWDKAMRAHFLVGFFATLAGVALVALIGLWRGGAIFSKYVVIGMLLALVISIIIGIILESQVVGNFRGHRDSQIIQSAGAVMAALLIFLLAAPFSPVAAFAGSAAGLWTFVGVGLVAGVGAIWCYQTLSCFGWI